MNNNIYKIYQLAEFFTNKFSFNNVIIKELIGKNEVWLVNEKNDNFNIIRISLTSLDETYANKSRIDKYIGTIGLSLNTKTNFLDIHISKEETSEVDLYDTICVDENYFSGFNGEEILKAFPGIDKVIHNVENEEAELLSRINSINDNIKKRIKDIRINNKPKFESSITNAIIIICSIVYLLSAIIQLVFKVPSAAASVVVGATYKIFTVGLKQYYRLVTYGFVHSSIIHLIMNMMSLFAIGNYVERKYGKVKYLILLLSCVLIGGLTFTVLTDNEVAGGMSAGIYGLFVIYIVDVIKVGGYRNSSFVYLILLNLTMNFMPFVAWQAHLGGAIAGIIFYYIYKSNKIELSKIFLLVVLVLALTYKLITTTKISPFYTGTDAQIVSVINDLGFKKTAQNLLSELYNYYINH